MPYVTRDTDGQITEVRAEPSTDARERIAPDDPELCGFLGQEGAAGNIQQALIASDLGLIRVLEDLIAVLIDKRIIMLTDMPKAAQQKLARRYELRSKLADIGGIVVEAEDIPLP
jgi:hypothetical protein